MVKFIRDKLDHFLEDPKQDNIPEILEFNNNE